MEKREAVGSYSCRQFEVGTRKLFCFKPDKRRISPDPESGQAIFDHRELNA
jgi:hypothetical protein